MLSNEILKSIMILLDLVTFVFILWVSAKFPLKPVPPGKILLIFSLLFLVSLRAAEEESTRKKGLTKSHHKTLPKE